ncbi:hypothetical protein [Aliivibrio fischeri]|uniref:hypothetical protein n=1 Tax=Aliivibrio fischeri TaxID=668 RepID=UPI00080E04E5|nr:hypothetical protein [Aliivibrio fischeri]OCH42029.1 hypothetical protein A6E02_14270 [Aliivibrio fischeri]
MWNFKELKVHLNSLGDDRQQYIDYLESISRMIEIFEYHKTEAYRIISKLDTVEPKAAIELILSNSLQNEELEYQVLVFQAHLQGALQCARSMYDIFAQLLNVLLIIELKPIYQCSIHNVCQEIPDSKLKNELMTVLNGQEYKYVNGFINTIKHRNLIKLNRTLDFEEFRASIRVKKFSYQKIDFEQAWGVDVLNHGLHIKNKLIGLGVLLNQECSVTNA